MKRIVLVSLILMPVAMAATAKPVLSLKASARHGYAPLTVTLTGDITGGDPGDVNSCLLSEEWLGDTPVSGLTPNSKRTIPCVQVADDGLVPRSFQREVTLKEPGTYIYRLLITPKGARTIASQSIDVKAVRSRMELKYTLTGTAPRR